MPIIKSRFCIETIDQKPAKRGDTLLQGMLKITFSSFNERDDFFTKLSTTASSKDYFTNALKAKELPVLGLIMPLVKEEGIAQIPEDKIDELLNYLKTKDDFDFINKTDRSGAGIVHSTREYNNAKAFFLIAFFSAVMGSVSSFWNGSTTFVCMNLVHKLRNAFKMLALEAYQKKADSPASKFSTRELNGFKIGVQAGKTYAKQFNSFLQQDAYSAAYYAGLAAEEHGEKQGLITKISAIKPKKNR